MEENEPNIWQTTQNCSFKFFSYSNCGTFSSFPNESSNISINLCNKNIKNHLKSVNLKEDSIPSEGHLICFRSGIFKLLPGYTVCPYHRYTLGIRWRRPNSCSFPAHSGKSKPESDRSVNKNMSMFVMMMRGFLLPVGSGICRTCRGVLHKEMIDSNIDFEDTLELQQTETVDDQTTTGCLGEVGAHSFTGVEPESKRRCVLESIFNMQQQSVPPTDSASNSQIDSQLSQASNWSEENIDSAKENLNQAISLIGKGTISPIKYIVRKDFDELQPSTMRYLKRKAGTTVDSLLNEIAPGQGKKLFKLLKEQETTESTTNDETLKEIIVNLYQESSERRQKKQLLSFIAKTSTKKELQSLIPGLSVHAIDEARRHSSNYGAGSEVITKKPTFRQKMDMEKMDHALDFFFSQNFHQISSFGTKVMKLKNGEEVTIPEVVRTTGHSTLVSIYQSFCRETDFTPLSRSTLYHILSVCPASHRTNLRGLDNIAADGSAAFETLLSTISDLERHVTDETTFTELQECKDNLLASKIYLKADYKLHLKQEDTCADHCINFALSDVDSQWKEPCLHQHDTICDKCELLPQTLTAIMAILSQLNIPEDIYNEMNSDINTSRQKIYDWKSHVVRTVNQDRARVKFLHNLNHGEALLIMDWAMKFLPLAFREKQTDWFGQKGVNWHVIVAIYMDKDKNLKHRTYAQTIDGVKQDWMAVACCLEHVLNTLKKQIPVIRKVHIRSDNAGCYHCENLWMALPGIGDRTGITVSRYDFSEAQSGKSYCDAKIAHMRSKIRRAVASGMNAINAADMKEAIDLNGGVSACQVAHVQIDLPCTNTKHSNSIKGISKISNIKFEPNGTITTWKAFEIGDGKPVKSTVSIPLPNYHIISNFIEPNVTDGNIKQPNPCHPASEENISCSESGCIKTFNSFSDMQTHCLLGDHEFSVPLNTYDSIKLKWKDVCFNLSTNINTYRNQQQLKDGTSNAEAGWALKKDRKNTRFSQKVRDYLEGVFNTGETTGRKANPATVARNMRVIRNEDGEKMFSPADYLEIGQITSYLSKLAVFKKTRAQKEIPDEELDAILHAINTAEAVQELSK